MKKVCIKNADDDDDEAFTLTFLLIRSNYGSVSNSFGYNRGSSIDPIDIAANQLNRREEVSNRHHIKLFVEQASRELLRVHILSDTTTTAG